MISQEYSEAIAETLDILEHTNKNDVDKIPKKFIEFLKENASKTYKTNLDYTKRIQDMNLNEKTIGILSIINKKYWCNEEERKDFEAKLEENEIEYQNKLREKYNPDNIFKSKNNYAKVIVEKELTETTIVKYKEKNFIQKFFDKIKNLFKIISIH